MLHFNADKSDVPSESLQTVPAEQIGSNVIDENENVLKVESTFKQDQRISHISKLIQNSNEYTSGNILLGSQVDQGIRKKEENLVTKEEAIENDENGRDRNGDIQVEGEDLETKLNS